MVLGADEPVVVINPKPMKAGNRPEGKTWGTLHLVAVRHIEPKANMPCEGAKVNQRVQPKNQNNWKRR